MQMAACDTRVADCFGTKLVHSAAQGGCCQIMEELVKQGHSLKAVGQNGRTCLHYAARGMCCAALAAENAGNLTGCYMHMALQADRSICTRSFHQSYCAHISMIILCCHAGMHLSMTRWLLEHDPEVDTADDAGETPLMTASSSSEPDLVNLLLSRGADVTAQCKTGCTALHLGVAQGETQYTITWCSRHFVVHGLW